VFTGWMGDGGLRRVRDGPRGFRIKRLAEGASDLACGAASAVCAGIIGFRTFAAFPACAGADASPCTGSAPAAHVAIQVARFWNIGVYASVRDPRHQKLALDLGAAVWAGGSNDEPPEKLDAAMNLRARRRLGERRCEWDIEVVSIQTKERLHASGGGKNYAGPSPQACRPHGG